MIGQLILRGVCDHFPARRAEWVLAAILVGFGIWLRPLDLAASMPETSRGSLHDLAAETIWAWGCLSLGALRLLALVINGTFAQTWYGRWSPHVRGSLAFASCFVWTAISIGIYNSEMSAFGLLAYPGLLLLEITNVKEAWQDAGEADRGFMDAAI